VAGIAKRENCYGVRWEVLDWNQPAIDFYKRLGATFLDQWKSVLLTGDALERAAEANLSSDISTKSKDADFSPKLFRDERWWGAVAEGYEEDGVLPSAWGEKKRVTSSSKKVRPVAPDAGRTPRDRACRRECRLRVARRDSRGCRSAAKWGAGRREKDVHGASAAALLQAEVAGIGAEISLLQGLEHATVAMEDVGSGREPFDLVIINRDH